MNDIQLFDRLRAGDKEAGDEIIEKHMGLVLDYVGKITGSGNFINLRDDLIQSGYEGLINARNRFESNQGNKFSTYAYPWIRKLVWEVINREKRFYDSHQLMSKANTESEGDELSASLDAKYNDRLVDYAMLRSDLEKILTPSELYICHLIEQGYTLEDIGGLFGVSRQRIHQRLKSLRRKIQQEII